MELLKYIGYKLEDVKTILDENNIHYKVIETFDTKQTKMGNEIRIVNIKNNQNSSISDDNFVCNSSKIEDKSKSEVEAAEKEIEVYVAYF